MTQKNFNNSFWENLDRLEGPHGVQGLVSDKPDLISRLHKALKHKDYLPDDLGFPEDENRAKGVNDYAQVLYELFCEGMETSENMMIGNQVEKAYEDIQDDEDNTKNPYDETGHAKADF